MLKKKVNGSWSSLANVKRKTNGSWSDCTSVKKKDNGSWSKVWPSSTFSLITKNFTRDTYLGRDFELDELSLYLEIFKTNLSRMDGAVFQIDLKGTGAQATSKAGKAYGDVFVKPGSDSFYLYIDQEIVESNKATVEAILLIPSGSEYYDWEIIESYSFTSSRQIKRCYIPGNYNQYMYLYFYISSDEFVSGSSTTPSATARIYGMWTDTTRYDLYY